MNRLEIKQHNQAIIVLVKAWLTMRDMQSLQTMCFRLRQPKMGYKELAIKLNASNVQTTRGNAWTFRSLYRMMQRQGVRLFDIERQA